MPEVLILAMIAIALIVLICVPMVMHDFRVAKAAKTLYPEFRVTIPHAFVTEPQNEFQYSEPMNPEKW